MKAVIAGGTGFLGRALTKAFVGNGYNVIVLSRSAAPEGPGRSNVMRENWDGRTVGAWARHVDGSDVVVNVAGESIGTKRWSPSRKDLILRSRTEATRALVGAMAQAGKKPSLLVSASAVGYYGSVEEGDVDEDHPAGEDFLSRVCARWEKEALAARNHGVRVIIPRFGVVLAMDGGALPRLMLPFRLFAGGWLGSGRQWFPWVHIDDVVRAVMFFVQHGSLAGPVNVVAPGSVTMKEFCRTLGTVMRRPCFAPVPAFALRLAIGEFAETLLTGQRVVPKKLSASGYVFQQPALKEGLENVVGRN